jgi:archaellum biogenesis protein FlaJ (TadC family)
MSTPPPVNAPFALTTRIMAGSLMGALVVIGVALSTILPGGGVSLVVVLVQVVAGLAAHGLLESVGYRMPPLAAGLTDEDAAAQARTRWQTGMILRFAISEFIAIASIAAAFVLEDGTIWTYLVVALVSLVLMGVHVWPWARPVGRTADALEAAGKRSGLRETFGV